MNIFTNPHNTPNFKQVSLVKVSKKAFKNPAKFNECLEIFDKSLAKLVNEKELTDLQRTLAISGVLQPIKFLSVLESPGFQYITNFLSKNNNKTIGWFEKNAGQKLPLSLSDEYFSFYVLSKKNIYEYLNKLGSERTLDCVNKALKATGKDTSSGSLERGYIKLAELIDEKFSEIIAKNSPINFKIKSLDELNNIIKHLDIIY